MPRPSSNGHVVAPSHYDPPSERKPPRIPSHIAWPMFVVLLLLMSVTAAVVTVIAANSDGGVQIVEDSPYDPNLIEP